jgi:hypothetical protein
LAGRKDYVISIHIHEEIIFFDFIFCTVVAQEPQQAIGTIEFVSDDLSRLIKKDAKVEILADGFVFTEGPVWLNKQQMVLLSDVPSEHNLQMDRSKR